MPVWIPIAIAAAGAIANYVNNEKARGERSKELDRLNDIANAIKDPNFDFSRLAPEDFQLVKQYVPQSADFIAEKAPQLVEGKSAEALAGRDAMMEALQRFRNLGQTGDDAQSQLLRAKALRDAQIQNQGQQGLIQQQYARRGLGGSGMEYVAALLGQQGSNLAANRAAEQAAMDAYNQRLNALRESSRIGGDIRGQEVDMEARNAAAINAYNQRMAGAQRDFANKRYDEMNAANRANIAAQQAIANANVAQRNQYGRMNKESWNDLQQKAYNAAVQKAGIQSGDPRNRYAESQIQQRENADMINSLATGAAKAYSGWGNDPEEEKKKQQSQDAWSSGEYGS